MNGIGCNISVITKIEFLGYKGHTPQSFNEAERFLNEAKVYSLSEKIVDKVIETRRKHSIKIADAVIASTSIINNFTLLTRNVKDFKELEIEIFNPFSDSQRKD